MWRISFLGLLPLPALAEVSDKAPTLEQLLISSLVLSVAATCAILWRTFPGIVASILVFVLASLNYDLLLDRFIGPALIQEQGVTYAWVAYGSAGLVYASVIAAWAYKFYKARNAA